jgi:hypothetical protein
MDHCQHYPGEDDPRHDEPGEPKALPPSPRGGGYGTAIPVTGSGGGGRSFRCPHMSIGNAASVECGVCGPLQAVS